MDAIVSTANSNSLGTKHARQTASGTAHVSVLELAHARLRSAGHAELSRLICEHDSGILRLRGNLPNHYLKQLAQELLKPLHGVDQIVNAIEVS